MNRIKFLIGVLSVSMLALGGCKKAEVAPSATGNNVDFGKLMEAFQNSPEEVRTALGQAKVNMRYMQFEEAIGHLDAAAADASTTEQQKSVLTNAIEQIKKRMATEQPAAPAQ